MRLIDADSIKVAHNAPFKASIKRTIEKQPTVQLWIPVKERLPEDGTYLCTLDGELVGEEDPFTGMCGFYNGKWDEEGSVLAWQPLPEPYKTTKESDTGE